MTRSTWRRAQRDAYLLSRTLGDVSAVSRGPGVLVKRLLRRRITRTLYRLFR